MGLCVSSKPTYFQFVMTVKLIRNTQLGLSLNKHIAIRDIGVPRYWVTVWEALNGHNFRPSTLAKRLSAIDQFYNFTTELAGSDCLDSIIASGNFDILEQYLEAFFIRIRNTSSQTNQNHSSRWLFVLDFARDLMFRLSGASTDEGTLLDLRHKIRRLDRLYASFRPKRQAKQQKIRALPASVIEELYQLTDPTSEKNPFRSVSQRWRNQALFLLYLHLGLRRAETLVLATDAIKSEWDFSIGRKRTWVNVTTNRYSLIDPRLASPSLKTDLSHRQIPLSEPVAQLVEFYITNFRGKQSHSYLFASSQGKPLSVRSINRIFDVLSESLSEGALRELNNRMHSTKISPHDCRHTCAVIRMRELIADGMDMELATQSLRVFFGWSRSSDMPRHYARAYFEERLNQVWDKRLDDRLNVLRFANAKGSLYD